MSTPIERVAHYVEARTGRRNLHPDEIHGLDVGCDTEAVLTLSDLRALLENVFDAEARAQEWQKAAESYEILYVNALEQKGVKW